MSKHIQPTKHLPSSQLLDITAPEIAVEVEIRGDGKVLWVNIDGECALRVCQIPELTIIDHRDDMPTPE